jgi:hypothetical protein
MQSTLRPFAQVAAALAVLCASSAWAATPTGSKAYADIEARYERERAACVSGMSGEEQSNCLQDARVARAEAHRGRLDNENQDYRRNALERCKALAGDEARDCRLRVEGAGTVKGSVRSGGLYRELVTIVPPAPAASSVAQ